MFRNGGGGTDSETDPRVPPSELGLYLILSFVNPLLLTPWNNEDARRSPLSIGDGTGDVR